MERERENERTNLLNENMSVKRNKLFTFTKYKNENAIGDSSSSEQNIEDPRQMKHCKKPGVVRKLEDDFKVYRTLSSDQSKASTSSKKGSWWKWGKSNGKKGGTPTTTGSSSRISCACKRLLCSDYVVMFILTVFFMFSTLLGLVIIFKAFPSLVVIVPADDQVRLDRKVDRLSRRDTDGLIDGALARNSRVGLRSSDYRSWNNPMPADDSVHIGTFDALNNADARDSREFAKSANYNNGFYKKLLQTAARFRKIKQNRDNNYNNDFVFGHMNRYKRSIVHPSRMFKRDLPNVTYHSKMTNQRHAGNKRASVINKRQSEKPMGVVMERKKMVLEFLDPQDGQKSRYQKPFVNVNQRRHKHYIKDDNFQSTDHDNNHFMEKKYTDSVSNNVFGSLMRKGKEKFNHFLAHNNKYDFNTFDNLDNNQFDFLKHHAFKDVKPNDNKDGFSQDIDKVKTVNENSASNEDPLINGFNQNKQNLITTSTTEKIASENTESNTETTLGVRKSTSAPMEKVPILRKLMQVDENYHESEDYENIKRKNDTLMNPSGLDIIFIETNNLDDQIQDAQQSNNDCEINVALIDDNLNTFADVEAAIIAEEKQANTNINQNYEALVIDVDGESLDLLQAYSDYGILQPPSDTGYKDKSKEDHVSMSNVSSTEDNAMLSTTHADAIAKKSEEVGRPKKAISKQLKNKNEINDRFNRRKLLSIKIDHSKNPSNSIVPNNVINKKIPKTKGNSTDINNTQITELKINKSVTNVTKIVSKRNVDDKDLVFWEDIYDDEKSTSKPSIQSVANPNSVDFAQKSESKSNFGTWISDKLTNVVENIKSGMKREPIKTNLKVHEVTRAVRDAKIPNSTNHSESHKTIEDKATKINTKREVRNTQEINTFEELEKNMRLVCKEAVKAVEDIKNIKVSSKEKQSTDGYLNNLLMGQLVSLMSELVDYQVEQKTCLKLPPDLREFLLWLTSAGESNEKQPPLNSALDELQMDNDILAFNEPAQSMTRNDPASSAIEKENGHVDDKSEFLETLEDVQELLQEYQSLPESEKSKMVGVKEYLEKQLNYLYKKLEETRDLSALPVLYTDPLLLRKRRNHHHNRVKRGANKTNKKHAKKQQHRQTTDKMDGKKASKKIKL